MPSRSTLSRQRQREAIEAAVASANLDVLPEGVDLATVIGDQRKLHQSTSSQYPRELRCIVELVEGLESAITLISNAELEFREDHDELDTHHPANQIFLQHEENVMHVKDQIEELHDLPMHRENTTLADLGDRVTELGQILLRRKQQVKEEENTRVSEALKHKHVVNTRKYFNVFRKPKHIESASFILLALAHYLFFNGSRTEAGFLLGGMGLAIAHGYSRYVKNGTVPRDVRTAISMFNLEPDLRTYVCCTNSTCCELYLTDTDGAFPTVCTVCNSRLGKTTSLNGKSFRSPYSTFQYQPISSWLGRLLSRPGIEDAIEETLQNAKKTDVARDIWHTGFFQLFTWPDGSTFWGQPSSNIRLLFSMGIDWYNAHHSGVARKTWSVGPIYLVCQSLPPDLRFLPANICLLGIIPGPRKPKGIAINNFLSIIVDDLLELWNPGVYLTRTYRNPNGRHVSGVLGPLVCDLDAIRGITGFSSHSSTNFCSYCWLPKQDRSNILSHLWPKRNLKDHWVKVKLWLNAAAKGKKKLWKLYGVRYSPLLELPYWDPHRYAVVDAMHNIAGVVQHHFRALWGMTTKENGWEMDGVAHAVLAGANNRMSEGSKAFAKSVLAADGVSKKSLQALAKDQLDDLAATLGLNAEGDTRKKPDVVNALLQWRLRNPNLIQLTSSERKKANRWILSSLPQRSWKYQLKKRDLQRLYEDIVPSGGLALAPEWTSDELISKISIFAARTTDENSLRGVADDVSEDGAKSDEEQEEIAIFEVEDDLLNDEVVEGIPAILPVSGAIPLSLLPSAHTAFNNTAHGAAAPPGAILGSYLLQAIQDDNEKTLLPSWLQSAPKALGTTGHGKATADQWRVLSTIHAVITLIRVWGFHGQDTQEFRMLRNFVDLARIATIAPRRSTSFAHRETLHRYMMSYLQGIKVMYPEVNIVPNHHIMLHLPDFLRDFGPVHSIWAFPYERLNGILQSIKTNNRFALLEQTLMYKFARTSNFSGIIFDRALPQYLSHFYDYLEPILRTQYRGTLTSENFAVGEDQLWVVTPEKQGKQPVISKEELHLLSSRLDWVGQPQFCKQLFYRGATYSPHFKHEALDIDTRNSGILIQGPTGDRIPARITRLVNIGHMLTQPSQSMEKIHAIVEIYQPLSNEDAPKDPYRIWPDLDCSLVYNVFNPQREVIPVSSIICHTARCPYTPEKNPPLTKPALVILGLDRS